MAITISVVFLNERKFLNWPCRLVSLLSLKVTLSITVLIKITLSGFFSVVMIRNSRSPHAEVVDLFPTATRYSRVFFNFLHRLRKTMVYYEKTVIINQLRMLFSVFYNFIPSNFLKFDFLLTKVKTLA